MYYVTGNETFNGIGEVKSPLPLHLHYSKRMIVDWFPHIAGTPLVDVVQTQVNKIGGALDWSDYFDVLPKQMNTDLNIQTRYEDLLTAIIYCNLPDVVLTELYPNDKPNFTKYIKSIASDKLYAVFFQGLSANLTEQEKIVRILLKCLKYNDNSDFLIENEGIYLNVGINPVDEELSLYLRAITRQFEIMTMRPENTLYNYMLNGYFLKPKELGVVMTSWKQEIDFINRCLDK